jgi:hypothetical protein
VVSALHSIALTVQHYGLKQQTWILCRYQQERESASAPSPAAEKAPLEPVRDVIKGAKPGTAVPDKKVQNDRHKTEHISLIVKFFVLSNYEPATSTSVYESYQWNVNDQ